jgi:hypothetical protein
MNKKTRKKIIKLYNAFSALFAGADRTLFATEIESLADELGDQISLDAQMCNPEDLMVLLEHASSDDLLKFKIEVVRAAFADLSPWFRDRMVIDVIDDLRRQTNTTSAYDLFVSINNVRRILHKDGFETGYAVVTMVVSNADTLTKLLDIPSENSDKSEIEVYLA